MLRLVHCMHSAEVLHADLKPDNLLLRLGTAADLQQWQAGSQGAWQHFGLAVIDFGRSMDLSLLTPGTIFKVRRNVLPPLSERSCQCTGCTQPCHVLSSCLLSRAGLGEQSD